MNEQIKNSNTDRFTRNELAFAFAMAALKSPTYKPHGVNGLMTDAFSLADAFLHFANNPPKED